MKILRIVATPWWDVCVLTSLICLNISDTLSDTASPARCWQQYKDEEREDDSIDQRIIFQLTCLVSVSWLQEQDSPGLMNPERRFSSWLESSCWLSWTGCWTRRRTWSCGEWWSPSYPWDASSHRSDSGNKKLVNFEKQVSFVSDNISESRTLE